MSKPAVDYFSIAVGLARQQAYCTHNGAIVERFDMGHVQRRTCGDCGADLVEPCLHCDSITGAAVKCELCRATFCQDCIKRGGLCSDCYEYVNGAQP